MGIQACIVLRYSLSVTVIKVGKTDAFSSKNPVVAIHCDITYTDLKPLNLDLITELMTKLKELLKIN